MLTISSGKKSCTRMVLAVFYLCLFASVHAQVILTEIMFDVEGADYHDEFIELYNLSATEAVDLSGWFVSDSTNTDALADAGEGMILQPGQYGIILDGSYFGNSTRYDHIIPEEALIVKIDNGAFGRNGLSNSIEKPISLVTPDSQKVQTYRCTLDNAPGYSDEKINLTDNNDSTNWGNSVKKGGTPGYKNSLSLFDFDAGFCGQAIIFHPSVFNQTFQQVHFSIFLNNTGLNNYSGDLQISFWVDYNRDSLYSAGDELIFDDKRNVVLDSAEIIEWQAEWTPFSAGRFLLAARIVSDNDQNPLNNFCSIELLVSESRKTVVINEINFLTGEGEAEWIELYNTGAEKLSLRDWAIADSKDTCQIDTALFLNPGQYKVLSGEEEAADFYQLHDSLLCILKGFPVLNNSDDIVYLLTPAGGWLEQVPYNIDWLEGQDWRKPSLERIHQNLDSRSSASWGPSTAESAGTPGSENSIFTDIRPDNLNVDISPNPFSPDADGFEDYTIFNVEAPANAVRLSARIFDVCGRKIRTLADNEFQGSRFNLVWDGRMDNGAVARMGIYIVFIQIIDDRNGILKEYKDSVVLAHKL